MVQKRVKAAKLHIYYEVGGQDLRITGVAKVSRFGFPGVAKRKPVRISGNQPPGESYI